MKLHINGNAQESSHKPLETFNYKLDESSEAVALIAETLRKSYRNPVQTSVQEYLSNARDIHRELGITAAINVQVPTELNPEFFIRDFGSGLSKEGIQDYITFARSTKRNSNLATGGFGLGSKSFFAYADSFTIISFYEKVKYIYRASCVKSKEGALTLISQTPTTEANGIQVQVAVRPEDRKRFIEAVFRLKNAWTDQEINITNLNKEEYLAPAEVLVAGANSRLVRKVMNKVGSLNIQGSRQQIINQFQSATQAARPVYFLVDGVPYEIDNFTLPSEEARNFLYNLKEGLCLEITVATGELSLSKYREYIETTPENQEKVNTLFSNAVKNIRKVYFDSIGKPKITSLSKLSYEELEKYFLFSSVATIEADFVFGDDVVSGTLECHLYRRELSAKANLTLPAHYEEIKTRGMHSSRSFYGVVSQPQNITLMPKGSWVNYDSLTRQLTFQFDRKNAGYIFHTFLSDENTMREHAAGFFQEHPSLNTADLLVFEKESENTTKFISFFHTNELEKCKKAKTVIVVEKAQKIAKTVKKTQKDPVADFKKRGMFSAHTLTLTDYGELALNNKKDYCAKKLSETTYIMSYKELEEHDEKVGFATDATCEKYRKQLAIPFLWDAQILVVSEELYPILLKEKNIVPFKDFKLNTHNKNPKNLKKAIKHLEILHATYLGARRELNNLRQAARIQGLPAKETQLINSLPKANRQLSEFIDSDFARAGLQKEFDKIAKRDGTPIFNLHEKYIFLDLIHINEIRKSNRRWGTLEKLIARANKRTK